MEPRNEVDSSVVRRGGQRRWFVVVAIAVLVIGGVVLFMVRDKSARTVDTQADRAEQAGQVQTTLTQYEQKSSAFAAGSEDFVNAKGIAALYAAEHDQCQRARELLQFETDGKTESITLKKHFDDEIGRLCKQ